MDYSSLFALGSPDPLDPLGGYESYLNAARSALPFADPVGEGRRAAGLALLEAPLGDWDSVSQAVAARARARNAATQRNQTLRSQFDLQTIDDRRLLAGKQAEAALKKQERADLIRAQRAETDALIEQMRMAGYDEGTIRAKANALRIAEGSKSYEEAADVIRRLKPREPQAEPGLVEMDGIRFLRNRRGDLKALDDDMQPSVQAAREKIRAAQAAAAASKVEKREADRLRTERERTFKRDLDAIQSYRSEYIRAHSGDPFTPADPEKALAYAKAEFRRIHGRDFTMPSEGEGGNDGGEERPRDPRLERLLARSNPAAREALLRMADPSDPDHGKLQSLLAAEGAAEPPAAPVQGVMTGAPVRPPQVSLTSAALARVDGPVKSHLLELAKRAIESGSSDAEVAAMIQRYITTQGL